MLKQTQHLMLAHAEHDESARQLFSAPLTVFGPLMAAIYIGQNYLVFRDSDRVRILTAHFDQLVRQGETGARELPALLRKLQNG